MGLTICDVITNKVSCLGIIKENLILLCSHILSCPGRGTLQCVNRNSLHSIKLFLKKCLGVKEILPLSFCTRMNNLPCITCTDVIFRGPSQ